MKKFTSKITAVFGNSGSGKTELCQELGKQSNAIYVDCKNILGDYLLDSFIDKKQINKGNPMVLFHKLSSADVRVKEIQLSRIDDEEYFNVILHNGKKVSLNKIAEKYQALLQIILMLRNKKNLILDNFDALYTGLNFQVIIDLIIKEIEINKVHAYLSFTDMQIWQKVCLSVPKDMSKTFMMTRYDLEKDSFENEAIDYKKLAFTINFVYNNVLRKAISEERPARVCDEKVV